MEIKKLLVDLQMDIRNNIEKGLLSIEEKSKIRIVGLLVLWGEVR